VYVRASVFACMIAYDIVCVCVCVCVCRPVPLFGVVDVRMDRQLAWATNTTCACVPDPVSHPAQLLF
jgi:hypothetical protein